MKFMSLYDDRIVIGYGLHVQRVVSFLLLNDDRFVNKEDYKSDPRTLSTKHHQVRQLTRCMHEHQGIVDGDKCFSLH